MAVSSDGLLDLIWRIQSALGTEETGDALVEVARNAHRAEQKLASIQRHIERPCDTEAE